MRDTTWSVEEDEVIRQYSTKENWKSLKELGEMLGRHWTLIEYRRGYLGLINKYNRNPLYSKEEDYFIRKNLRMEDPEIGKILGRSGKSITARRKLLGLLKGAKELKWNEEELTRFKKLYPILSRREMRKEFPNRSTVATYHLASDLGLEKEYNSKLWNPEEIETLKKLWNLPMKELKEALPNRTITSIRQKATLLGMIRNNCQQVKRKKFRYSSSVVILEPKMAEFVKGKSNLSAYIRGLIEADMKK